MIQIKSGNILIRPINRSDIETIRIWRNSDEVRRYFEYNDIISKEEQELWFEALDPNRELIFIMSYADQDFGVLMLKNIDQVSQSAEAGVFIGNPKFENTPIPILAITRLLHISFQTLGFRKIYAKMHRDNHDVINMNQALGYKYVGTYSNERFKKYELTLGRFRQNVAQLLGSRGLALLEETTVIPAS